MLAAGQSERFGSPKPLLRWGNTSLIAHQVRTLAAVSTITEVIVVTGYGENSVRVALEGLHLRIVHNADHVKGRATSVACGVNAAREACAGVLIASVDQPLHPSTLGELVGRWVATPGSIVRPIHDGLHGHPVIFPSDLQAELASVDEATEGVRAVMRRHAARVLDVPTGHPAVLFNLNTPRAYRAALAARAEEMQEPDGDAKSGS